MGVNTPMDGRALPDRVRLAPSAEEPSVTVIIPTHERREQLRRTLSCLDLEYQRGARFEVIVGIDGSSDGTGNMLSELRTAYPLRFTTVAHRGASAARNAAIARATGDVLLFIDDDALPQPGIFERHLAVHRRDRSAVVIGRMGATPGGRLPAWLDWEAAMLARHYARIVAGTVTPGWREFFTANASVRREHVLAVGGFDERFIRAQDIELGRRLAVRGLRFYFASDAVIHHEPDRTLETWLRLAFKRGSHHFVLERESGATGITSMQEDWRNRHWMSRMLARWCVGHRARARFVTWLFRPALSDWFPRPLARLACSALFNVQYWEGVADAAELGPALWRRFIDARPQADLIAEGAVARGARPGPLETPR